MLVPTCYKFEELTTIFPDPAGASEMYDGKLPHEYVLVKAYPQAGDCTYESEVTSIYRGTSNTA